MTIRKGWTVFSWGIPLALCMAAASVAPAQYAAPPGGWSYAYEAAAGQGAAGTGAAGALDALDGTWGHDNGSDTWDGSTLGGAFGDGNRPGGVSLIGDAYIRAEDTGDPRDYGFAESAPLPSNRKIYLGHDVSANGASATVLDDGCTLNFRVRVPTSPPVDDLHPDGGAGVVAYPATGDGYLIHDGGKGNIGIKQSAGGIVSFSLTLASDTGGLATGILMNNLNGAAVSGDVDSGEAGTPNVLALDPTLWQDVYVTIAAGGTGTHVVTVYLNGSTAAAGTFDVTAGTGSDFAAFSYIAIGAGSTGQSGALDVDFVRFASGVHAPVTNDLCADALAVAVPSITAGSTSLATLDTAPTCGTSISAPGVWFKVTGTGTVMTASLCSPNTTFDTKINVYTDGCGTLTCVAGNDDGPGVCADPAFHSLVNFPSVLAQEYLILVQGFGGEVGDFELSISALPPPPAHDLCAGAVVIDLGAANPATVMGDTRNSTTDSENDTCGDSGAGGLWYSVAGTGGMMDASNCNAGDYDSRISVFSGACGALACVVENDDAGGCGLTSSVRWSSVLGAPYLILVHGFDTSAGTFTLTVSGEEPPCLTITGCRADQSAKTATLTWEAIAGSQTGYDILADGLVVGSVGAGVLTFTHSPALEAGCLTAVEYVVRVIGLGIPCEAACTVVLSPGNVCFADDFEDHLTDLALEFADYFRIDENLPVENATWTVSNPGGRANPPIFDGRASTGRFVISDSDDAGGDNGAPGTGRSHDLWSPSFSTMGKSAVWLHMDTSVQLNNNGVCTFDVDVSTNDGASWANVFRRVAPGRVVAPAATTDNADGFFGRLDVDLSSVAGQPGVRFRLRHFEPSDDWWIAVDNVIVDDVAPKTGLAECLLVEAFDAGIPATWSVVSTVGNTGNLTWTTADPCVRAIGANPFPYQDGRSVNRLDGAFAIMDSDCDPDPTEDELLITAAIDCSNMLDVVLEYDSEIVITDATVQEVLLSIDGGATFLPVPLFSYSAGGLFDGGEDPAYAHRVIRVEAAIGQPSVAFAFHYASGGDMWWWAIDNVKVTGTPSIPPGGLQVPGDCNQDGALDISDGVCIFGVLFTGIPALFPCGTGLPGDPGNVNLIDWQPDLTVDISDGIAALRFLFSGGPSHPDAVLGNEIRGCVRILGCPDNPRCN